jgi:hypothetical protein
MSTPLNREEWPFYLASFNRHNQGRPTELKVFDHLEVEHQLPLNGIVLEETGEGAPKLEILLGDPAAPSKHIARTITRVQRITPQTIGGRYEGLEIMDGDGVRTTLSFTVPQHLLAAS